MPETPELRSFIMRQIKSKDVRPEMMVRWLVFGLGYRYRLHRKTLPGRPAVPHGSVQAFRDYASAHSGA